MKYSVAIAVCVYINVCESVDGNVVFPVQSILSHSVTRFLGN